jgi:hypothetical protein
LHHCSVVVVVTAGHTHAPNTVVHFHHHLNHLSCRQADTSSDEEDEEDSPARPRKPIPSWAQPAKLLPALQAQARVDPDAIFSGRASTCNLVEVFAGMPPPPPPDPAKASSSRVHKKHDYTKRGSSGNWMSDRITLAEDVQYKKAMGYM